MDSSQKQLSPNESLDLITEMIQQTKGTISENSFYFLVWGWVIAFCNFGMYGMLKYSGYPQYAAAVWLLAIPAWILTMVYGNRQDKERVVSTHLDKVSMWLWIGTGIAITPSWIFGSQINWLVNAVILMPLGTATLVTGIILRFRPLYFGAITFWVAGILCYLVGPYNQYLVGGVAMILGYLVPGYLLRAARS